MPVLGSVFFRTICLCLPSLSEQCCQRQQLDAEICGEFADYVLFFAFGESSGQAVSDTLPDEGCAPMALRFALSRTAPCRTREECCGLLVVCWQCC